MVLSTGSRISYVYNGGRLFSIDTLDLIRNFTVISSPTSQTFNSNTTVGTAGSSNKTVTPKLYDSTLPSGISDSIICTHDWKEYNSGWSSFVYCGKCDKKKE